MSKRFETVANIGRKLAASYCLESLSSLDKDELEECIRSLQEASNSHPHGSNAWIVLTGLWGVLCGEIGKRRGAAKAEAEAAQLALSRAEASLRATEEAIEEADGEMQSASEARYAVDPDRVTLLQLESADRALSVAERARTRLRCERRALQRAVDSARGRCARAGEMLRIAEGKGDGA